MVSVTGGDFARACYLRGCGPCEAGPVARLGGLAGYVLTRPDRHLLWMCQRHLDMWLDDCDNGFAREPLALVLIR